MGQIKTFGDVDQRSLEQLERCMAAGDADYGVLCADHHPGYSQPIGGGIAYEGHVSPSGVGYDIGCGNKAVRTDLTRGDLDALGGVEAVMGEITRRISFGMGVPAAERSDHPVLDRIRNAEFAPQRKLAQLAESQLGTVGLGQPLRQRDGRRGRPRVGRRALRLARVRAQDRVRVPRARAGLAVRRQGARRRDGLAAGAVRGRLASSAESYIAAMELAGEYAYAGRDIVVAKVLEILGADAVHEVHNHHNFAWLESHHGRDYWVVRKGCTPARPGQEGFVGGSMGDDSVILEGVESAGRDRLAVLDGARRRPRDEPDAGGGPACGAASATCAPHRDCGRDLRHRRRQLDGRRAEVAASAPTIPSAGLKKVWVEEQVKPGVVDWPAVQARLREQGIVLVGGGADEAPEVYKRLPEVLAAHGDSIRVKHTLRPLGVAMAGRDVVDPYKD